MKKLHPLLVVFEMIIFLLLGYLVYCSHGWALGASVSLMGITLLSVQDMCKTINEKLNILHDEVNR